MSKPVIGLMAYRVPRRKTSYIVLQEVYLQAVLQAGGTPVLIPVGLSEADLRQIETLVDGIVFTGGGDIEPALYGGKDHPSVAGVDLDRDRVELSLARRAVERGIPFLAICRGMQVVNVALGGDLYMDIAAQVPEAQQHDFFFERGYARTRLSHPVQIQESTITSRILGQPILEVNSMHHQAVKRLAADLVPTAYAPDGILEGFELPGHPYGVAVQWHPEWLTDKPPMRALFEGLAAAAMNRGTR